MCKIERDVTKTVIEVSNYKMPEKITKEHNLMRDIGVDCIGCMEIKERLEVSLNDDDVEITIDQETTIENLVNQIKTFC